MKFVRTGFLFLAVLNILAINSYCFCNCLEAHSHEAHAAFAKESMPHSHIHFSVDHESVHSFVDTSDSFTEHAGVLQFSVFICVPFTEGTGCSYSSVTDFSGMMKLKEFLKIPSMDPLTAKSALQI